MRNSPLREHMLATRIHDETPAMIAARDARLDRLRTLWRLYGYELRLLDGWYPEARITIAKGAGDGHLDMNEQLHGHWKNNVAEWTAALKAGKHVYDL